MTPVGDACVTCCTLFGVLISLTGLNADSERKGERTAEVHAEKVEEMRFICPASELFGGVRTSRETLPRESPSERRHDKDSDADALSEISTRPSTDMLAVIRFEVTVVAKPKVRGYSQVWPQWF